MTEPLNDDQVVLAKFYDVDTKDDLIRAQEEHIKKLQEKLAAVDIRREVAVRFLRK